jgi:ABC-2 type transport system ATP-binding protein
MDEALRCDRIVLMRAGRIIADTTPAGLLAETGETDPDAAFLRLVEKDAAAEPHPRTRREARHEEGE